METYKEIGNSLITASKDVKFFSLQRGVLDELFPYVHYASKRMSSRAISRYLEQEHGVKLSHVSIARALKNPETYWNDLFEQLEPSLRIFSKAHNTPTLKIILDEDYFAITSNENPIVYTDNLEAELDSYDSAKHQIENEWFSLPADVRDLGITYYNLSEGDEK